MLATNWEEGMNEIGWWMSEKFDGIRALWTGEKMYSRNGKEIKLPQSLLSELPSFPLDGELWLGYGLYQDAVSLSRTGNSSSKWDLARYNVFDAPPLSDSNTISPFEERLSKIE